MASHGPGAAPGPGGGAGLYEALGLSPGAPEEAIRSAITEQRRAWRRRTTSADIGVRHEAERRMQLLDDAERTLLDAGQRRAYDTTLGSDRPAPTASETSWLVKAVQQMEAGQHEVATFTARHAVDADPENPYAWAVLADAAAGAGDRHAAMNAIERAIGLDPENAALHVRRGAIFAGAGEHDRALGSYRAAAGLAPGNMLYHEAVIGALKAQGRLDTAITEAERMYQANPDNGEARNVLAQAIADRATAAQHELPNGALIIASLAQASHVESLSSRGLSVQAPDPLINDELRRHRARSHAARKRRLTALALRRNYRYPLGAGLVAAVLPCCAPSMAADSSSAQAQVVLVLATVAALAIVAAVLFATCFEPVHKRNERLIQHIVPRRNARGPGEPDGTR